MAERKILILFLANLVVVGALVSLAIADACIDDCYKECDKGKKDDVPSCTKTCDSMCRLKDATREYAAETPTEKAAMVEIFKKEATDAGSAAAASTPGFATLKVGCLRECSGNICRAEEKDCTTRCDNLYRVEVESLTFAAKTYANTPDADRNAVIQAIEKHASGPTNKIEAFATISIGECNKMCEKDPACVAICDNGCRAKSVSVVFSSAMPAEKDAINKDIQTSIGKASNPVGTA